ncbi:hypothetical protein Sme01_64140 [Sphaerisporangium melleum]|uniref:JAB domain-containing protein n=1 Tax=Sphaerisporangium melleum TaxID=321316 RepID=A0A917RF10_9ACTN|nr:hypothetical protein [Sphaerisporangium melleum]GGL05072.1 hypothetical protein GCM10007964_54070 [Sphaerisporangium melleum]GII73938.1 hypothetical protein Sme01_64140 [Sphaerisporangium melleum]
MPTTEAAAPPAGVHGAPATGHETPAPGTLAGVRRIELPRPLFATIAGHVVRKLTGHYIDGEVAERKAFGLLLGRLDGTTLRVAAVLPLLANMRRDPGIAGDMDELVDQYAIPSETPNEQRGWIAHPRELMDAEDFCDDHDLAVVGNYHTHRVPWPQDPRRDTCTRLDRLLAEESGQWVFIVSATDLHRITVRAFYEGRNDREAEIVLRPATPHAIAIDRKSDR